MDQKRPSKFVGLFFFSFLLFSLLLAGLQTQNKCLQSTVPNFNSMRKLMIVFGKITVSHALGINIVFKFAFLRLTIVLPSIAGTLNLRGNIFHRRQTLRLHQNPRRTFPLWRTRRSNQIRWCIYLRRRIRRRSRIWLNQRSNRRTTTDRPNRRRRTP